MNTQPIRAVFFDLGDTLGEASSEGDPPRLVRFDAFPYAPEVLAQLQARGLRCGIISNTGDARGAEVEAVVAPTGLLDRIDPALRLYSADEGVTKASPEIFDRAAACAGVSGAECVFVGEDSLERHVALTTGWRVCPHPQLVFEVLDGEALQFVRLTVPPALAHSAWRETLRLRAVVPLHASGPNGTIVVALTSQRVMLELVTMQFAVELLGTPGLPQATDLFLLRDDIGRQTGFLKTQGDAAQVFARPAARALMLSANAQGVLAAVPADLQDGIDALHFDHARHGHTLKLMPDPLLWAEPAEASYGATGFAPPAVPGPVKEELNRIDADAITASVERYAGQRALDGSNAGARIRSRHILSPDNARAVRQLVADLTAAGAGALQVHRHAFSHAGRTLHNVEAELRGASSELVLVTAHLDSSAAFEAGFDPRRDPAPGADDDASGVAAVLAVAECFSRLAAAGTPKRTVRFVLFNAEEQGLIGSRAYARRCKARGEAIAAVWQMDMIGFNDDEPRKWELHVGHEASAAVEERSALLADLLIGVVPQVASELPAPAVFRSDGPVGDPAAERSDHAAFHAHGFAACLASEDFFVDSPAGAPADANPHYHGPGDLVIDAAYASDIARAVSAAAWLSATT
ncbi:M20/M25/M40 family metallo-hydrolase [Variovorax guangxiensis]|uniref:M20/M25/M40 family metallo-hydrolase n=1 Tax=Variovorax guangxiensis TaxID=1775474 RepID=UPI00285F843D|nr:M20/M25/M40 family metallo-hydrolase [Variovorax guangxiensis]MDR6859874.1 FMN phosphatase YigB (HAD superfamily) [Variovorax guangxiensis]